MKLLNLFWRFLRFPLHPCFFLLLVFAILCVALQYPFYGEWLLRYPLFALIFALLLLVTYNRFGQDFGLSHLFWHENAWTQGRMGFYISLLLALQWGISYEILRDFDGNQRFEGMASYRDRALLIPTSLGDRLLSSSLSTAHAAERIEHHPEKLEEAKLHPVHNANGPFRYWRIDVNEARVADYPPDGKNVRSDPSAWEEGWQISNRLLLYLLFTYFPSLALLGLAVFPPIVPRRDKLDGKECNPELQRIRGAGDGRPFLWGMASAAILVVLPIFPFSMCYASLFPHSLFTSMAEFFHTSWLPLGETLKIPVYPVAFALIAVALYLNHKDSSSLAPKLEYPILGLLLIVSLFTILQLRVWFPDPSVAQGAATRITDWRAVEMILNIFAITTIVAAVYFKMRYALRHPFSRPNGKRAFLVTSQDSIVIMLAFLSVAYGSFVQLVWLADVEGMPIVQGGLCIPFVAFLMWRNSDRFKLRFPGMANYYVEESSQLNAVSLQEYYRRNVSGEDRTCEGSEPLHENLEVLENWRKSVARDVSAKVSKPKLAIVAVSGGSIRSGLWTAKVLTELEQQIPEFPYHLRLITGASGGMIGASLYAAGLEPPASSDKANNSRSPAQLEELVKQLKYDCLNPVACQLALGDLPALFSGRPQRDDRGQALERAWDELSNGVLSQPFDRLSEGELQGWRPSLIFSPMLAEDGRRLLISNLDLKFLTRSEGPFLLDRASRWLDEQEKRHPNDDLYSLSAYQFYQLFPKAKPTFRLSTAIRMSASFPYISPAVNLPTVPPRRVVDAGYYDNFGINIAMSWVSRHRQWLLENTSGVVLIQVRAFDSPRDIESSERNPQSGWPIPRRLTKSWAASLHCLTTPLKAVFQARSAGMSFRNDEQISMLAEWFREHALEEDRPEFFQTVSFDCNATASLNWYITQAECDAILGCLAPDTSNRERLQSLQAWWNDGSSSEVDERNRAEDTPCMEAGSGNTAVDRNAGTT